MCRNSDNQFSYFNPNQRNKLKHLINEYLYKRNPSRHIQVIIALRRKQSKQNKLNKSAYAQKLKSVTELTIEQ